MNWMPKWALTGITGTAFALGLGLTAISSAQAQDKKEVIKKTQAAIVAAGAALAKGDSAKVAEVEKFDLDPIMAAFKPRMRGGIGFGEKAGLVPPNEDGIESKCISLGKKPLSAGDAEKFQGAVSDLAYQVLAIGKATDAKWPESKDKSKSKEKWLEFNAIMKEGATELGDAAKAKDSAKIKASAAKINRSCNECHTVFRD
jgi:cytochrome c556